MDQADLPAIVRSDDEAQILEPLEEMAQTLLQEILAWCLASFTVPTIEEDGVSYASKDNTMGDLSQKVELEESVVLIVDRISPGM